MPETTNQVLRRVIDSIDEGRFVTLKLECGHKTSYPAAFVGPGLGAMTPCNACTAEARRQGVSDTGKCYPFIARCRSGLTRHVPVPLWAYPIDLAVFSRRLMALRECPTCGAPASIALTVDFTDAARGWYDRFIRETDDPHHVRVQ